METCFNWTDSTAYMSSDERKWITKVRTLQEERPDEVTIIREPENNDGCIYAKFPAEWVRVRPKRVLSEGERAKQAEICRRNFRLSPEPRLQTEFSDRTGGSDASDEYLST